MDRIASLIEDLSAEIRKQVVPEPPPQKSFVQSLTDSVLAFVHAVDWTEPWLIALLSFHVVFLLSVILTRKNNNVQTTFFLASLFGVYIAERLNRWLANRWTQFARQPYFDHHGIFISTVWSGPLLLISCVILVNGLLSLSSLIIKWKRAELRHRARLESQKTQKKKE